MGVEPMRPRTNGDLACMRVSFWGWLRSEENHQLTTSLDVAQKLSEHAQRMLAFRSYVPPKSARLGMVNYEDSGALLD